MLWLTSQNRYFLVFLVSACRFASIKIRNKCNFIPVTLRCHNVRHSSELKSSWQWRFPSGGGRHWNRHSVSQGSQYLAGIFIWVNKYSGINQENQTLLLNHTQRQRSRFFSLWNRSNSTFLHFCSGYFWTASHRTSFTTTTHTAPGLQGGPHPKRLWVFVFIPVNVFLCESQRNGFHICAATWCF